MIPRLEGSFYSLKAKATKYMRYYMYVYSRILLYGEDKITVHLNGNDCLPFQSARRSGHLVVKLSSYKTCSLVLLI